MEEIATAMGMSKRTVYAYYKDKDALFKAAVERAIERYTVPGEALEAVASDDLEATLKAVARLRVANVATATGIKLQRVLNAQSHRFPELYISAFEVSAGPTLSFLSELFTRLDASGEVTVSDPRRAAIAFLSLVVGGPARTIRVGSPISDKEVNAQIDFTVGLFLNGIRRR